MLSIRRLERPFPTNHQRISSCYGDGIAAHTLLPHYTDSHWPLLSAPAGQMGIGMEPPPRLSGNYFKRFIETNDQFNVFASPGIGWGGGIFSCFFRINHPKWCPILGGEQVKKKAKPISLSNRSVHQGQSGSITTDQCRCVRSIIVIGVPLLEGYTRNPRTAAWEKKTDNLISHWKLLRGISSNSAGEPKEQQQQKTAL